MKSNTRTRTEIFLLIGIVLASTLFPIIPVKGAWLSGYTYRKSHTINGTTAGAQTDYQVGIKVYFGNGVDGTEVVQGITFGKVYLDSKCRVDFGDIRFTNSSGEDLLDYWIKSKTDSNNAIIWVEVDYIPASPNNVNIYIYYGKADATTTSNITSTSLYNIGDDFNDNNINNVIWTTGNPFFGASSVDETNQRLEISGTGDGEAGYVTVNNRDLSQVALMAELNVANLRRLEIQVGETKVTASKPSLEQNIYEMFLFNPQNKWWVRRDIGGAGQDLANGAWASNSEELEIRISGGSIFFYEVGVQKYTQACAITESSLYIYLYGRSYTGYLGTDWIDTFFIRKYVTPEPTHHTWGPEELDIHPPSNPDLLFGSGFNASSPYVELHWNHSLVNVQFFEIQNSSDSSSWTYLGQSTTANYTDTQVTNGTERYYRVRACNQTGGEWYNSSFTDINFETVYFIPRIVTGPTVIQNVTGEWFYYNLTSINVNIGTHDAGDVNSTLDIDADTFDVSETVGAPAWLISFNWANVDPDASCLWVVVNSFYDGNLRHDIDLQLYNFTGTSWTTISLMPDMTDYEWINASIYDLRIPNDYVDSSGAVLGRIIHNDPGNINHDIQIEFLKLHAFIPSEVTAPTITITEDSFFWVFIAIVLSIITALLMWLKYEHNNN